MRRTIGRQEENGKSDGWKEGNQVKTRDEEEEEEEIWMIKGGNLDEMNCG